MLLPSSHTSRQAALRLERAKPVSDAQVRRNLLARAASRAWGGVRVDRTTRGRCCWQRRRREEEGGGRREEGGGEETSQGRERGERKEEEEEEEGEAGDQGEEVKGVMNQLGGGKRLGCHRRHNLVFIPKNAPPKFRPAIPTHQVVSCQSIRVITLISPPLCEIKPTNGQRMGGAGRDERELWGGCMERKKDGYTGLQARRTSTSTVSSCLLSRPSEYAAAAAADADADEGMQPHSVVADG